MNEHELLARVCGAYRAILGEKLTGFYVHGSIAFGCFTWATGDIDFLAVVNAPLTQGEKEALVRILLDMSPEAPPKGFEMSVVLRAACRHFRYPTPFELHFSNSHKARAEAELSAYCRDMHGTDPDLAAHFTVVRSVGYALWGEPVEATFGEVPRESYVAGILADVENAPAEIGAKPVYMTLNLCRVLAYLEGGAVLSKRQGGRWGMARLPEEYRLLVQNALAAYEGADYPETPGLETFAAEMLRRIRALA